MMTETKDATTSLRLEKAHSMPFQEVSVIDQEFTVYGRKTLNETNSDFTLELPPGRYMVIGLSPSGARTKIPVTLRGGDQQSIAVNTQEETPHRWLAETASRQQLPQSLSKVSNSLVQQIGTFSVDMIREVSPVSSLSLPIDVVSYAARGLLENARETLNKRLDLGSRAKQKTRRPQDLNIRSYYWSGQKNRWLRSDLIDMVKGDYALDYTRLVFPSRQSVEMDEKSTRIHVIGVFLKDKPSKYIALPLFADGAQLVISHGPSKTNSTNDSTAQGYSDRELSWRLSAVNERVDALLQALNGRGYEDRNAISQEALKIADHALYAKRSDPEAAVVAGLFLLQYRQLDVRAQWVENLANWFPWSPDALTLGAWSNILFDTGDETKVLSKLSKVYSAGPPQFLPARRLLRDLLSIYISNERKSENLAEVSEILQRLWERIGREMQHEIAGGPFYSFAVDYTDTSSETRSTNDLGRYQNLQDRAKRQRE